MALREVDSENFSTLLEAAKNNALALVECKDAETGEYRAVLCAIAFDGEYYNISPFGHLCSNKNPFEAYIPLPD